MENAIRAQIWDNIDLGPVPTQVLRHGPVRGVTQRKQCECDLIFLKDNSNEFVIGTDKIIERITSIEYFNELKYAPDTIFKLSPNPKCS